MLFKTWFAGGDVSLKDILTDLQIALFAGVFLIVIAVISAAFIFTGQFSRYLQPGIILSLVSIINLVLFTNLFSSYRLMSAHTQNITFVIYSLMLPQIYLRLSPVTDTVMLSTFLAIIIIASLCIGILLYGLGRFRLGNIVRFIPYPVMGGFLAGTGWYLLTGALPIVTGYTFDPAHLHLFLDNSIFLKWFPAVALGAVLYLVQQYWQKPLVTQAVFVLGFVFFYLVLWVLHIPINTAMQKGFLLGPFSNLDAVEFYQSLSFKAVQWHIIPHFIIYILMLMILTPISLLLNITGIELATNVELDADQELKAGGIANFFCAITGGGIVGFHSVLISLLNKHLKAKTRLATIGSAVFCFIILLWGMSIIAYFPRFLTAALLVYFGIELLINWVIKSFARLRFSEYATVLLILFIITLYGFLEGILSGLIVALIIFTYNYSRVQVIKLTADGKIRRSNVDRDEKFRQILFEAGEEIYILQLQGYLFFGNANNIVQKIKDRLSNIERKSPNFIILDFNQVQGMDSSSELSFIKLITLCTKSKIICIFCDMTPQIAKLMQPHLIAEHEQGFAYYMSDLDHAMEWCENKILTRVIGSQDIALSFRHYLQRAVVADNDVDTIITYLEPIRAPANYDLFKQDEKSEDMYFIESGKVEIFIRDNNGNDIRLRSMGPGTTIGEIAFYLGTRRTANVRTVEPCVLYRLTAASLIQLEQKEPRLCALLHRYIACQCMLRLSYANSLIQAFSEK